MEIVFLRPQWTKVLRCVTVRGNPAREIERALCFAALGLPLIRSALADICQAKNVFWTFGSDPFTVCYSTVTTTEHSPLKREYGDI